MKKISSFFVLIGLMLPCTEVLVAQTIQEDLQGIWRARVVSIESESKTTIPGTETEALIQNIQAELLEGEKIGQIVRVENDFLSLEVGDKFFLNYLITLDGNEIYTVADADRRGALIFFMILFAAVILFFGGKQGLRSLLALFGSLFIISYALIPSLTLGFPPVLTSVTIAVVILFLGIFLTHGWNRESLVAFLGTCSAVLITGILATFAVDASKLSGFASDESVFLNMQTGGTLDFAGLLLGGIIIGILGVLDDIAVTQAAVVRELFYTDKNLSRKEAYTRAIRVGKEHVGALVNTLALAYAGTSLPLLLLFYKSEASAGFLLNSELFATEIIRTIIGSIGLVLTVPITTGLAVWLLKAHSTSPSNHTHSHGHAH